MKTGKICVFACFPAGTLVHTEAGSVAIEQIVVGDKVWAYDEATGETALKEVVQTVARECDHTIELYTADEMVETTAEHPFLTREGWKDAADLQVGDEVRTRGDELVQITRTRFSYEPKQVYNFEVAEWHTYFVGALAWLVHNAKGKCLIDLLTNPKSIWGKSADDIAEEFTEAGFKATIEQSTKGSKKSIQIRIEGHPEITNIQVHPGGGRHVGEYYKISTSTQGKIKVVNPKTYKPDVNEKVKIINYE